MADRDWRGSADVDLGSDHWLKWSVWRPDLSLEGNQQWAPLFTEEALEANGHTYVNSWNETLYVVGATILHVRPDGDLCQGGVMFERAELGKPFNAGAYWTVESWEPLTLSPSILCKVPLDGTNLTGPCCDDHGYVRSGRWVSA